MFVSLISAQNPPPAATRYKLGRIIVALSDNANLRRESADREVGSSESRVQIAEAPQAERAIKTRGKREGRLLKGIRIVGRSDRKSPVSRCEIARVKPRNR